ncbi:NAD(P)-dependent dehydrogenase, short-chain alcohol dehydrogenase family [Parasphingorhabdus marina DSM 22363]|uniref:Probable oxidoreductase n=1 Tax=Parasphingorhabdus marina DSM 22363 TaxID=1123272 RepID=A0A1N6CND4_9SPHN|nr:oxidoreductase [Parasphingorhabdus marina]SIN60012.1 NAD(P)-dependent dehydrogenase, short-chain alcohol dehydrogenase family [Parasphingorhabdus marina DSM 22363]
MAAADQTPLGSGFPAKSEPQDVLAGIDLTGKTAIVTGGYSGIGLETTRALASKGATVIVPVRDPAKAEENLATVTGDVSSAKVDLADLDSVRGFASSVYDSVDALDLLINNAGIMACPLERVGPGWESQFGVNHMGHFALTKALLPLIEKADAPRVVALSSIAHKRGGILWDDIQFEKSEYHKWVAYAQAKSANALFANALSRRMADFDGRAFSVHPGGIFTPLQRHLPKEEQIELGWLGPDGEVSEGAKAIFKTPEQGCTTTLWAATSSLLDDKHGLYCEDCDVAQLMSADSPPYLHCAPHIADEEGAERLWDISEELLAEA